MARGGQRGYGNAGRSAYSGGTRGSQGRAVFAASGGFASVQDAALGSPVDSNAITLAEIGSGVPLTIAGGSYSKNGAAYSTAATTVSDGDTLQVRLPSSSSYNTTTTATVTIGANARTFRVTTIAATIFNILGTSTLRGVDVEGFAPLANDLHTRLAARGF